MVNVLITGFRSGRDPRGFNDWKIYSSPGSARFRRKSQQYVQLVIVQ